VSLKNNSTSTFLFLQLINWQTEVSMFGWEILEATRTLVLISISVRTVNSFGILGEYSYTACYEYRVLYIKQGMPCFKTKNMRQKNK